MNLKKKPWSSNYCILLIFIDFFPSNVTDQMQKVCISISPGIPLRGDIMINCYHKAHSGHKDPIWKCQFHTCAISNYNLLFSKEELDDADRGRAIYFSCRSPRSLFITVSVSQFFSAIFFLWNTFGSLVKWAMHQPPPCTLCKMCLYIFFYPGALLTFSSSIYCGEKYVPEWYASFLIKKKWQCLAIIQNFSNCIFCIL